MRRWNNKKLEQIRETNLEINTYRASGRARRRSQRRAHSQRRIDFNHSRVKSDELARGPGIDERARRVERVQDASNDHNEAGSLGVGGDDGSKARPTFDKEHYAL